MSLARLAPRPDETDDDGDALPTQAASPLRSSDTESLPADDLVPSLARTRLTRRTLESINPPAHQRQLAPARSRLLMSRESREHSLQSAYAPATAPSTGSSTLVERDDHAHAYAYGSGRDKGKGRATAPLGAIEQEHEGEGEGEQEDRPHSGGEAEGAESSSPARQPRSRGRGVGAYLDAHPAVYSTPPHPPRTHAAPPPATPLAPGAYPPTAQKPRPSPTAHSSSASPISASSKVHNIFTRLDLKPRASTAEHPRAVHTLSRESPPARPREPPTPHGPGHYNFSPQTTRSPVPPRGVRFGDAPTNGFGSESGDEASDEDEPPPAPDPVLRKALRRIQQQKKQDEERAQELDDYFPGVHEDERRRQQERPGDYEGDDDSSDGEPHAGGRSAIAYAMEASRIDLEDIPMQSTPNPRRRATYEWDRTPPSSVRPSPPRRPISPKPHSTPPHRTLFKSKPERPTRQNPPSPTRSPSPELPPALPEFQSPVPSPEKPVRRPLRHPQPYPSPTLLSPPRARASPPRLQSSTSSSQDRRRASQPQVPIPSLPKFAPSTSTSRHRDASPPRHRPPSPPTSHHRASSPHPSTDSSPDHDRLLETASELRLGLSSLKHDRLNALGLPSRDPTEPSSLERKRKESDKRMRRLEEEQAELERAGTVARRERTRQERELEMHRDEGDRLAGVVEDLSRTVREMGAQIGAQVTTATERTIKAEFGWRTTRLLWLLVIQVVLLWLVLRIANARAEDRYNSLYFDPFYPALFQPPAPLQLLPETLHLFPPPDRVGVAVGLKEWVRELVSGSVDPQVGGWDAQRRGQLVGEVGRRFVPS